VSVLHHGKRIVRWASLVDPPTIIAKFDGQVVKGRFTMADEVTMKLFKLVSWVETVLLSSSSLRGGEVDTLLLLILFSDSAAASSAQSSVWEALMA
jgi:hypothetical protein